MVNCIVLHLYAGLGREVLVEDYLTAGGDVAWHSYCYWGIDAEDFLEALGMKGEYADISFREECLHAFR